MAHMNSHEAEFSSRFKCKLCNYVGVDNWNLKRHNVRKHRYATDLNNVMEDISVIRRIVDNRGGSERIVDDSAMRVVQDFGVIRRAVDNRDAIEQTADDSALSKKAAEDGGVSEQFVDDSKVSETTVGCSEMAVDDNEIAVVQTGVSMQNELNSEVSEMTVGDTEKTVDESEMNVNDSEKAVDDCGLGERNKDESGDSVRGIEVTNTSSDNDPEDQLALKTNGIANANHQYQINNELNITDNIDYDEDNVNQDNGINLTDDDNEFDDTDMFRSVSPIVLSRYEQIRRDIICERELRIAESGIMEDIGQAKKNLAPKKRSKKQNTSVNAEELSVKLRRSERTSKNPRALNTTKLSETSIEISEIKIEIKIELPDKIDDTDKSEVSTEITPVTEAETSLATDLVEGLIHSLLSSVVKSKTKTHKFKCKKCEYSARDNHNLTRHTEIMHSNLVHKCLICGAMFAEKSTFVNHKGNCHYTCPYPKCSKVISRLSKIDAHKRMHIKLLSRY